MRYLLSAVVAGLLLFSLPGTSSAQYPGFYPNFNARPFSASTAYVGPYGYRSFANVNAYPTPFGYNSTYNYGSYVQPYSSGPYHSVYFNPYLNTYQYGTGYLNTPTYSYFYGY